MQVELAFTSGHHMNLVSVAKVSASLVFADEKEYNIWRFGDESRN